MSSYEEYCNDYAVNGNPMRDHYDYEMNADYDRWDGHRGDMIDDCYDDCCPTTGTVGHCDCADCIEAAAFIATLADCDVCDDCDVPF